MTLSEVFKYALNGGAFGVLILVLYGLYKLGDKHAGPAIAAGLALAKELGAFGQKLDAFGDKIDAFGEKIEHVLARMSGAEDAADAARLEAERTRDAFDRISTGEHPAITAEMATAGGATPPGRASRPR
jgi:hypothetical protein